VDEALESDVYLDGIIALVDAKHILQHLDEVKPKGVVNEAQRQIAFADRIIINKVDLSTEAELQKLEERIKEVNAMAPVSSYVFIIIGLLLRY
jgi:G3E family GTPase